MSAEIELEEEFARTPLKRATLRRLLGYFAPHKKAIRLVMLLEATWVLSMIAEPALVRVIVDGELPQGDVGGVMGLVGLMVVNIIARAALTTWELRLSTRVGVAVVDHIRRDVFDHVQRLSMRYFDRTKQGRIIARADRDVDTLEHLIFWGPILITMMILSLSISLVFLLIINAQLALWLLAAIPVVILTSRVFHRFGFPAYRRIRETHSAISAHVAESIGGVRVVQAFGAEGREQEELEQRQHAYRRSIMHGAKISGGYLPALGLSFHGAMIAMIVVGGHQILSGGMPIGEMVQFLLMMGFVLGPVEGLGGLYNESLVAGAAAERIFLLLDTPPEVADRPGARDAGRLEGEVVFDHVWFAYDGTGEDGWQLEDVSFRIAPGETVALVGHTGAGKTSIINLMARFYEPQKGEIRLDGTEIRDLTVESLHRQTGTVLQSNFLFSGTLLENLRFVDPELTAEAAEAGFEELGCRHVLEQLPDGLLTDVGERGANLSEGERQIVCFVRALLAQPTLLIFDEATSAVDTRTEAMILEALRRLAAHQTTVVIAHRLSTIKEAKRIFVMEQGRIVEEGTHRSLLTKGGTYATLYAEYET